MKKLHKLYSEYRWQTIDGFDEPQLLMWIPYYNLGELVEQYEWCFETENNVEANLQQDCCLINISELFGQDENEELEKEFSKFQSIKDGWIK